MSESKTSIFKKNFDFYIFSNIHVALAAFCLTKITLLEVGISDNTAPFFVFLATLISYNMIRLMRLNSIKSWFNNWFVTHQKHILILLLLAFLPLLYLLFQIRLKPLLVLFPFALFTLLYTFPVSKFSLREKPGVKLFLIALSWAGITVFFPLVQNFMQLRDVDFITFLQRFLFVFAITIPFDIRDLQYDKESMKTIPQQIGIQNSKRLAIILIVLFFILEFFKTSDLQSIIIVFLISVLSILLIYKMIIKRSKYYTSFFIEALPIVWLLLYVVLTRIIHIRT